jgi:hypothetical protein
MKLSDFTIDSLPEGKHLVVWYNNVHHFQITTQDYFIIFIIRDMQTGKDSVVYRNVKESPDISLGSIIYNKRVTDKVIGDVYTSIIDVPVHNKSYLMYKENIDFYKNEKYFSLPENIELKEHTYSLLRRSQEQRIVQYNDLDGNIILFPSYVIAQYYYYRSSSMAKQVMAHYINNETALQGLYKSIHRDQNGNAKIVLKPNAKGRDGAEIFRFAIDEYANYNFHRVYKDLVKSKEEIKAAFKKLNIPYKHNTASLSALFPFHGKVYLKYRGVKLSDGRMLALEILAEDSKYPFQTLTIYRQSKKLGAKPIKIGSYQGSLDSKISDRINDKIPSNIFTPIEIYSELKEDGRLDLEDKKITHDTLYSDGEVEAIQNGDAVDYETDASFTEAEPDGDINTTNAEIETSTNEKPDGWDEKERVDLEAFLIMVDEAQTMAAENGKNFNYFVNDEQMLPQKPGSDKSRNQWAKSLLVDDKTPRAYSCAFIQYDGKQICAIDVERDHRVKGLSVLIMKMNNNTQVSDSLIKNILLNFVKEKGSWLQGVNTTNFKNKRLIHPDNLADDSIKNWARRFLTSIDEI